MAIRDWCWSDIVNPELVEKALATQQRHQRNPRFMLQRRGLNARDTEFAVGEDACHPGVETTGGKKEAAA